MSLELDENLEGGKFKVIKMTKDQEIRHLLNYYISQGIDKKIAFNIATKGSTLGTGYIAQMKHDYSIGMFT